MTVDENLRNGKYENQLPWPARDLPTDQRRLMRDAYKLEERAIEMLFKSDLEEEYGVQDNPKKDELYRIAWENGHSAGLNEVWIHYDEMVGLIK